MQKRNLHPSRDASLESTIATMRGKLAARGFELDESSWLNLVDAIWSVHVRDRDCPMLFANGKGVATKYLTNHLGWFRVRDRSTRFSPDPAQVLALAVRA